MHKRTLPQLPQFTVIHVAILLLFIITATLAVSTGLLGAKVRILWAVHNSDMSTVKQLIKDANERVYHPAIINPAERKQYIYESSLRFPLADAATLNLRYFYAPADTAANTKEQVIVATETSINAAYNTLGTNVFANVAAYQRCSKEFIIQFNEDAGQEGFTKTAAKQLADGRTAYIYKNTSCSETFKDAGLNMDAQQAIVDAIESY
jgi:hypothetical protein